MLDTGIMSGLRSPGRESSVSIGVLGEPSHGQPCPLQESPGSWPHVEQDSGLLFQEWCLVRLCLISPVIVFI